MKPTPVEAAAAEAARARDARYAEREADRRRQGVVHTPAPLARFLARRADRILRSRLQLRSGLADPRVVLLDPACGPGAFLAASLAVAGHRRRAPGVVVGRDLDAQALSSAHDVLSGPAEEAGWPLTLVEGDSLDSLEPVPDAPRDGVWVVLGNPPWAGRSDNRGAPLLEELLEDFRRDGDGSRLKERKIGVLSDAYVRFLRWGAELVRRAPGGGVLAMVTNGSWLDGPVHRGVRAALLRWFAEVEIVDLGGNALVARGERRDDNVFGVRPGVALVVAHRPAGFLERTGGVVRARRLWGTSEEKLAALEAPQRRLRPSAPLFLLSGEASAMPQDWVALPDLMPFHREGVQTNRDAVVIDADREALRARLAAPAATASGIAASPTAPLPPITSSRSPAFSSPIRNSACSAVSHDNTNAVASAASSWGGTRTSPAAGRTTYCALEPIVVRSATRSPSPTDVTPSPTASTTPTKS